MPTKLRIVYHRAAWSPECEDLAVTPLALTWLSAEERPCLKPIDYFSRENISDIKAWVTATVELMESEWRQNGFLPLFIRSIGFELCVLLETLTVADLVLSSLWNTGRFAQVQIGTRRTSHQMVEYPLPYYSYADLLADKDWRGSKSIDVCEDVESDGTAPTNAPRVPFWRARAREVRRLVNGSRRLAMRRTAGLARKLGFKHVSSPELIVAPHKDTAEMLNHPGSLTLDTYLAVLPDQEPKAARLASDLIESLEGWFRDATPAMRRLRLFKGIVRDRLCGFIRERGDLVAAYVKVRDGIQGHPPAMLLASSGGCSPDAWASMALQEKGGLVASGQHGGSYGNLYFPYFLFCDCRFDYFFSYGNPELSPVYEFAKTHGSAKWISAGSPVLEEIRRKRGQPPDTVTKVLYIMNLSVSFYSANFPWEHILWQLRTLELLNRFSAAYSIDVKEEQTGAVRRDLYPGLHFIKGRPKDVLDAYDLVILESGMSTAVLEGASTNKFLVIFTGCEWEDVSAESLELLSQRAECFHRWDEFLEGLDSILQHPVANLDRRKLESDEFLEAYGRPVSSEEYMGTIRHALSLS